jgi:hypothetical protein
MPDGREVWKASTRHTAALVLVVSGFVRLKECNPDTPPGYFCKTHFRAPLITETPVDEIFDLRSLPRPTVGQYAEFAAHVAAAHSWYKHLPLLTGGWFVVFLAPDSGIGRLVARIEGDKLQLETPPEGPVFTEANPRIHYSWTTSEEYRRRFGFLDYAYVIRDGDTMGRDVGGPMVLPEGLLPRCAFTLFPYVSGIGHGDTLRSRNEEALVELRAGATHPRREAVLEWVRLSEEQDASWQRLTAEEQQTVSSIRVSGWMSARYPDQYVAEKHETTPAIDRHLANEAVVEAVYNERLRSGELAKIRAALDDLRDWLDEG